MKIIAVTEELNNNENTIYIIAEDVKNKYFIVEFIEGNEDDHDLPYNFSNIEKISIEEFKNLIDNNISNFYLNEIEKIYNEKYKLEEGLFNSIINFSPYLKGTFLKENDESCLDTYLRDFFLDTYELYKIEVLGHTDFNLGRANFVHSLTAEEYETQKVICNKMREKCYPKNFDELSTEEKETIISMREDFQKEINKMKLLAKQTEELKNYVVKVQTNIDKLQSATRKLLHTKEDVLNTFKTIMFVNENSTPEGYQVLIYKKYPTNEEQQITILQVNKEELVQISKRSDAIVVNSLVKQNKDEVFNLFCLETEEEQKKLFALSILVRSFYKELSCSYKTNKLLEDFCGIIINEENKDELTYVEKLFMIFFKIMDKTIIFEKETI